MDNRQADEVHRREHPESALTTGGEYRIVGDDFHNDLQPNQRKDAEAQRPTPSISGLGFNEPRRVSAV